MDIIKVKDKWVNTNSGNEIEIVKYLGKGKWFVSGKLGKFKIRETMIRDNYKLKTGD